VLRSAPLFAGMPGDALAELGSMCVARRLDPGEYLFHAGEHADNLYVVASGALDVVRQIGDQEILLNVLGPGRAVGELALLRGEPRSASVRARGATLVYSVDGQAFLAFVHTWPQAAIAIARQVAENLVRAENKVRPATERPLWAIVASDDLPAELPLLLARAAVGHLAAVGRRVVVLSPGEEPGDLVQNGTRIQVRRLDAGTAAETHADTALVIACGPVDRLGPLLRRATGVIHGPAARLPPLGDKTRAVELARSGATSARRVRLGASVDKAAGRLARLLLGRSVGVALGGGAARGFAHVGVLHVLEELGVPVDFLAGTSMGGVVGAFVIANGARPGAALWVKRNQPSDWLRLLDPMMFVSGMVRGKKLLAEWQRTLAARAFEDLEIPFAVTALDIETGEEHVLGRGRLVDGMLATISIPGIFAPYAYRPPGAARVGRFVDGGVSNNVPVDAVRAMGADRVIGVHAMGARGSTDAPRARPGWLAARLQAMPTVARAMTLLRSQLHAHQRLSERQVLTADVAILADTSDFSLIDFWRAAEMVEVGRRAALQVEAQLRQLRS
jgi:NTE family protein